WRQWLPPCLIAVVTFVVFVPALHNGFVDWDDKRALHENPYYQGLGWDELRWMWTTMYMGQYRPLTWMTYGADYVLWGWRAGGYHLTNLLLHVVNAVLVYWVARRVLGLASRGVVAGEERGLTVAAGVAALLFAL